MRRSDWVWPVLVCVLCLVVCVPALKALETTSEPSKAAVINLDAPVAADWSLLVRVGQTQFAVPRTKLKQFVLQHPEWLYKEAK